jgi:hypothetical protein
MDCVAMPPTVILPATSTNEAEFEFSAYDLYDVWFDGRTTDDIAYGADKVDELDLLQEVCF